ncbi:MAG: hypothetical protein J2P55_00290 [Rhizobiales bacterium]|nr:hypothetical protein [Hyphomicrobiales bacterium]
MNSIPLYRDFGVAGELTHRPRGEPAPAQRGLLRRVLDAIERSRQRAANREIARIVGGLGADDRLTDEMERRLLQHLTGDRGFRP